MPASKASGSSTFWKKHVAGCPPFDTHSRNAPRSWAQLVVAKHEASSLQQFVAVQLPHWLPSDGHVTCEPHFPLMHGASQHCVAEEHIPPVGTHAFAQTPFWHVFEQHWPFDWHICPSPLHGGGGLLHTPFWQMFEQHWPFDWHICPGPLHGGGAELQTPPLH